MNQQRRPFPSPWSFRKLGTFFLACLGGAAWMRLFVREGILQSDLFTGSCSLWIGLVLAWVALQRWRLSAPRRCAVVVGFCGGVAGAGLVMVLTTALMS